MPDPSDSSPFDSKAAVESLLALFPQGFTVTPEGELIDRSKVERVKDFQRLADIAMAPKILGFDLHGQRVEVEVRGLTGEEAATLDEMEDPRPPERPKKDKMGRPIAGEMEMDWHDAEFTKAVQKSYELKRAILLSKGLVGFEIPGETAEEKKDALKRMFPPHVLDLLHTRILDLTSNKIELASFT